MIELDLSGNRLFSITPEAFEGLNRLEILRLDMNRLASIPLEALIRLPGKFHD
jgi:Leucine-rich repeat (LRR) protein